MNADRTRPSTPRHATVPHCCRPGQPHATPGLGRVALGLVLAALLLGAGCASRTDQLRVLTYNIHHGEGTDGRLDLPRLARTIASVDPHLVALQEVDLQTERTGGVDQAVELSHLTGMAVAFGANLEFQGGLYGNAVLSRVPIVWHRNHPLPNPTQGEPRGALEVGVARAPGDTVVFISTHFDHQGQASRVAAAETVNALFGAGARPAVLAGDLNATRDNEALSRLGHCWIDAGLQVAVRDPQPRQIDHVLYRPQAAWRAVEVRVLADSISSDHQPVLTVLERVAEPAEPPAGPAAAP